MCIYVYICTYIKTTFWKEIKRKFKAGSMKSPMCWSLRKTNAKCGFLREIFLYTFHPSVCILIHSLTFFPHLCISLYVLPVLMWHLPVCRSIMLNLISVWQHHAQHNNPCGNRSIRSLCASEKQPPTCSALIYGHVICQLFVCYFRYPKFFYLGGRVLAEHAWCSRVNLQWHQKK